MGLLCSGCQETVQWRTPSPLRVAPGEGGGPALIHHNRSPGPSAFLCRLLRNVGPDNKPCVISPGRDRYSGSQQEMPETSEQEGTCPGQEGKGNWCLWLLIPETHPSRAFDSLKPPYPEEDVGAVDGSGALETETEVGYTVCQPPIPESVVSAPSPHRLTSPQPQDMLRSPT